VQNGENITISLSGTSPPSYPLPSGQPVWKYRQMQFDASYGPWQEIGVGPKFNFTSNTSGVFQVEAVFFGDDADAIDYVRKHDELDGAIKYGRGKTGDPDCVGVADTTTQVAVRNAAQLQMANPAYSFQAALAPVGPNSSKCNLFVAQQATAAGATVPNINWTVNHASPYIPPVMHAPPVANQWAGVQPGNITGWTLLPQNTPPQPGFVVAHPSAVTGAATAGMGHCGILDYDGVGIAAGSSFGVSKMYPFLTPQSPSRFRKYSP